MTCAKAKRGRVRPNLRLRAIRQRQLASTAVEWVRRLGETTGDSVPAAHLYRGDHWKSASEAAAIVEADGGTAWVCSAGYGLIPFDAPVWPYSATFTPGDLDSVLHLRSQNGEPVPPLWWDAVAAWAGPSPGRARRIASIAADSPRDLHIVVISEPYLRALTPDLLAAREQLRSADRMLILCGGAPENHPLAENMVGWDSRLQIVPGAMTSMNARVARRLLEELPIKRLSLASARKCVASWAELAPSRSRPSRQRVSDSDVREFIRNRFAVGLISSPSGLHREFRESGLACERLRFLSLFRSVS